MDKNICEDFIKGTSYFSGERIDPPELHEELPPSPNIISEPVALPSFDQDTNLLQIINHRRSKRNFENKPLSLVQLSKLCWGTQGETGRVGQTILRAVASAGNRHPFNTYILINKVEELLPGLYFYNNSNSLGPLRLGELGGELSEACLGQKMIESCSVVFIWTAATARTTSAYRARGYRYIFLDAGHIGAQLQLLCVDLGLGSCNIGAFWDDKVAKFLGVKHKYEVPIYITAVGWPK